MVTTKKSKKNEIIEELKNVRGGRFHFYEDVDSWVISPYKELETWVMEQFRCLKKNSQYVVKKFVDKIHNIYSDNIKVHVDKATIQITAELVSETQEKCCIIFQFLLDEGYPLY